ncbi:hypothetical protein [Bartonella bilalgolemii]|uniref:Phage related protein n=1 Tax=Bartonella bilalgolemii TaxID=2942911 RepID=A0ABT0P8K9_9HYPH|nr:hypothetical protein [Bartonella sp. G70]MCL6229805.1 hypothetical protein [Bartonella sp. G70]
MIPFPREILGHLLTKIKATIYEIKTNAFPSEEIHLSEVSWVKLSFLEIGDMKVSTYDSDNLQSNAFSIESMIEGYTKNPERRRKVEVTMVESSRTNPKKMAYG